MTDDERTRDASTHPGFDGPVRDWLSHRVAATPDEEALIHAPSGDSWTFRELDELVTERAGQLAALGVEAGDHVAVILPPGIEYVLLIHASVRIGAKLVPLSERLTASEVTRNLELADATVVVCGEDTEPIVVEASTEIPTISVDEPRWEGVVNLETIAPKSVSPAQWSLSETMILLFTSGTTGAPKAVRLSMGNILSNAVASSFRLGLSRTDRWMVTLSLHHMGGIGPVLRSPLYGTAIVLREGFDAGSTADDIDKYDVTGVSLVPTMLKRMLEKRGTLSDSLRVVLLGGAPAPDELIERCRDYSVPVYPTYGMTETASQIATATPDEAFDAVGTVGRPIFFADLWVVDEDGNVVESGDPGEIVVSGPSVSSGYYDNPEATEEAFSELGLHTGDIGYRDEDGLLYVLNRKDDRIITGGENVDPGEVVDVLRRFPSIDDAVVVGIPDVEWGERVAALVVPTDAEMELDRTAVEDFCREHLAGFKIPRLIEQADELPRTVSGTIDRDEVKDVLNEARPVREAEPDWNGEGKDDDESESPAADVDESLPVDDAEAESNGVDDEGDEMQINEGDENAVAGERDDVVAESEGLGDADEADKRDETDTPHEVIEVEDIAEAGDWDDFDTGDVVGGDEQAAQSPDDETVPAEGDVGIDDNADDHIDDEE
ncbi:o-succinylbenzoate--CoA ligase [Haloferax namakaokahaiae]|uniref:2-succinylbenzoate--CoA ligase n=1 Tax=Haloferax namakaokahaiae TaxID=1748331 RepID=A0ABD5ZEX9_9EURY